MASFERHTAKEITNVPFTVHASNAYGSYVADIVIGLVIANSGSTNATASAYVKKGTADTADKVYLAKGFALPIGGSVEVIQGKVVLNNEDELTVIAETGQVDAWLSMLDNASA